MGQQATKTIFACITAIMLSFSVAGQSGGSAGEDLARKAEKFFHTGDWTEAMPLYAQLVSVYPENPQYNYRFGVCSLLGDRTDSERPVRYLGKAYQSMPDDPDVIYYLGLAYFQDEEFASARKLFFDFLDRKKAGDARETDVNNYINSCQRGLELIHKNQLDEVLSKSEFQYENFHRAYPADDFDGTLILKPENFISDREKKDGTRSFVYISDPGSALYFSGYREEASGQRDLFRVTLNKKGEWGKPEPLTELVNSPFDEDYPVVTADGKTLYFSSKGHNSMGGYDVFRSDLDEESGEFSAPENMGVGINSPFDDILYIPDRSGHGAYFASNRENKGDNITVFRVSLNDGMTGPGEMLAENADPAGEQNPGPEGTASAADRTETAVEEMEGAVIASAILEEHKDVDPGSMNASIAAGETADLPESILSKADKPVSSSEALAMNNAISDPSVSGNNGKEGQIHTGQYDNEPAVTSNPLKIKWELIYDTGDQDADDGAIAESGDFSQLKETKEFPTVIKSSDPVRQVQYIRYASHQPAYLEDDEPLEVNMEPELADQDEPIAFIHDETTADHVEAGLNPAPARVAPVQLVHYAASQDSPVIPDEELEIFLDAESLTGAELIELAFRGGSATDAEKQDPISVFRTDNDLSARETYAFSTSLNDKDISDLLASGSGLPAHPEPISVPMIEGNAASHAELIDQALKDPDVLTYEELLFAASIVSDPGSKLKIYYASFVRSDRDWRAYYNASIVARNSSNTDKADVYLYQASLISDDVLVGQIATDKQIPEVE